MVWLRGGSALHNASLPLLVDALNKVIDEAIVDIGKVESQTLGKVGIAGLNTLKRTHCHFVNVRRAQVLEITDWMSSTERALPVQCGH